MSTLKERFFTKVDQRGMHECWPWKDAPSVHGYGQISSKGIVYRAHRLAYQFYHNQPLDPEQVIMHLCNNKLCCNPHHLHAATQKENMQHRYIGKLTDEQRQEIKTSKLSARALGAKFGVAHATILRAKGA